MDAPIQTIVATPLEHAQSRIAQLEGEIRRLTADRDGLVAERETWRAEARAELLAALERYAAEARR